MSFINHAAREINVKVVYYGATSDSLAANLQCIHSRLNPASRGEMRVAAAGADRVMMFDFVPAALGTIRGFQIRVHVYALVGATFNPAACGGLLSGVDGVVFVADSDPARRAQNRSAWDSLCETLAEQALDWRRMPLVVQLDRREDPPAPAIASADLQRELGLTNQPLVEAQAQRGVGVFEAVKAVVKAILVDITKGAG